ncbi:hypothetical protein [Leptolyngbya sp. Cla-17]|uniref:hypothetical protein n=1 Tax=Leptolyngbya sp. Cla-17 TaxID=2803751 RepID=UPI001A92F2CD|nr:hypothetical protein [Leptolyngbya sp. Cla-17]
MEEPFVLKQRIIHRSDGQQVTVNSLINETKPSLILARYEGKILLEVIGLDASEARSQRMGRRISEVVLWVGDASSTEVEFTLRQLAASALLSLWDKEIAFVTTIRNAIAFDGLDSFKADAQQIEQLYIDASKNLDKVLSASHFSQTDSFDSIWSTPVTVDADEQLHFLAHQISQALLSSSEEPVVVVAELRRGNTERRIFYRGNVWAAPPAPKPVEEPSPQQEELEADFQKKTPILSTAPASRSTSRIIILVVILLIVIVLVILWLATQLKSPLTPAPILTPSPTPTLNPIGPPAPTSPPDLTVPLTPDSVVPPLIVPTPTPSLS